MHLSTERDNKTPNCKIKEDSNYNVKSGHRFVLLIGVRVTSTKRRIKSIKWRVAICI